MALKTGWNRGKLVRLVLRDTPYDWMFPREGKKGCVKAEGGSDSSGNCWGWDACTIP
jgi:hypothetical protein